MKVKNPCRVVDGITGTDISGLIKGAGNTTVPAVPNSDYATPALVEQRMRDRGEIDFDGVTYYPNDVVFFPSLTSLPTLPLTPVSGFLIILEQFTTALNYYDDGMGSSPGPIPTFNPEFFSPATIDSEGLWSAINMLQSKNLLVSDSLGSVILSLNNTRRVLRVPGSGTYTITVPPQSDVAWPNGSYVRILRNGTGTVTIVPGTGVTINNQHGSLAIARQYGHVDLVRISSNQWILIGDTIDPALVGHTHTESDITDLDKYTQAEVDAGLANKANVSHTHTEAQITDLDKYTQSEVDSALAGKANTSHTHTESDITDLGDYIEKVEDDATPKLGGNLDADNKNITALRRALLPAIVKGSLGSSETFDFAEASAFTGIVNDNATYTISNLAPGQRATIELTTSGIGGPFAIIWAGIDGWAQSEVLDEVAIGVSDYLIVTLWNSGSKVSAIFDEFGA
jgi:hypothetical protein